MLLKIFKNLDTEMAILVPFEQILGQTLCDYFTPNSDSFTKDDAFC